MAQEKTLCLPRSVRWGGCAQWGEVGAHGRLGSPDGRFTVSGERQFHSQTPGGQSYRALEPGTPFLGADAVRVGDLGFLAGVEREAARWVLELEPHLLERVPVVFDGPAHRLVPTRCRELEFFPGQRVAAVEGVGPFRFGGVSVDSDSYEVAGDGLGAVVMQEPAHAEVEASVVVAERRLVLQDQQAGARRRVVLLGRLREGVGALPCPPQCSAGVEFGVRPAGELGAAVFPAGLKVAHVRGVDVQALGESCLRQAPHAAPVREFRSERSPLLPLQGGFPLRELLTIVSERSSWSPHPARLKPNGARQRPRRTSRTACSSSSKRCHGDLIRSSRSVSPRRMPVKVITRLVLQTNRRRSAAEGQGPT